MVKAWVLLLSGLSLAACQRGCRRSDASPGTVAEPGSGEGPRVDFEIDKVYEHQQPSQNAPWHAAGGDWTFFDAHTKTGTRFGFGWQQSPAKDSMAFGKALWSVSDPNEGADLIRLFARAFDGKVPPPMRQQTLHPQPFSLVSLGDALGRNGGGGFSGPGTWHATKLFLQRPGVEAEVFLNFDLVDLHGEFAEKDGAYTGDLLLFMARELRDGPPPVQTPETDARISLVGPKLGEFRPIGPAGAIFSGFEAGGARVIYHVKDGAGTRVVSIASEGPPQELEIVRLEHDMLGIHCAATDDPCLVHATEHKDPKVFSSDDPDEFLLVRRAQKQVLGLVGPWGSKGATTDASMSPDGKFVVIGGLQTKPPPHEREAFRVLHFVTVDAPSKIATYVHGDDWPSTESWQGSGAELCALVRLDRFEPEQKSSWVCVDPRSGAATDLPDQPSSESPALSPDGKHRFSCNKDQEILITDVTTGAVRSFPVAPRERQAFAKGCDLTWRGPHFLELSPERTAFLDVDSLKLSFPFADGADPPLAYDRSFSWAIAHRDANLAIARVAVR
jgi:hypothetical protein